MEITRRTPLGIELESWLMPQSLVNAQALSKEGLKVEMNASNASVDELRLVSELNRSRGIVD